MKHQRCKIFQQNNQFFDNFLCLIKIAHYVTLIFSKFDSVVHL